MLLPATHCTSGANCRDNAWLFHWAGMLGTKQRWQSHELHTFCSLFSGVFGTCPGCSTGKLREGELKRGNLLYNIQVWHELGNFFIQLLIFLITQIPHEAWVNDHYCNTNTKTTTTNCKNLGSTSVILKILPHQQPRGSSSKLVQRFFSMQSNSSNAFNLKVNCRTTTSGEVLNEIYLGKELYNNQCCFISWIDLNFNLY